SGDGGGAGTDGDNPDVRIHTYTGAVGEINFSGTAPLSWDIFGVPNFQAPSSEAASFYVPLIPDPKVSGTWLIGLQHVWRTTDNLGGQAFMDLHCDEFVGDLAQPCGDWEALGGTAGDLIAPITGDNKGTGYVAAIVRTPSDTGTMWVATRRGRVWLSKNADAAAASVTY